MKNTLLVGLKSFFWFLLLIIVCLDGYSQQTNQRTSRILNSQNYQNLKSNLIQGWNTWNNDNILTHIKMPIGFAVNVYVRDNVEDTTYCKAVVKPKHWISENIKLGNHALNGSFTELDYNYKTISFSQTTASNLEDFVAIITPTGNNNGAIVVHPKFIWNKQGKIINQNSVVKGISYSDTIPVYVFSSMQEANFLDSTFSSLSLNDTIYISTGRKRTKVQIYEMIRNAKTELENQLSQYKDDKEAFRTVLNALAWNTIYEPQGQRVITTVSRLWNLNWGGYISFCWDNYFASYMSSLFDKNLAFANAIEITNEYSKEGFIPNFATIKNRKSEDRSQPPVGSLMVRAIYKKYPEKWFLKEVFDNLLVWNRWWVKRRTTDDYLCWGSNNLERKINKGLSKHYNSLHQAKLESGLDNSPMYDDIPYDSIRNQMKLGDVGLMSLYIADCKALADIAHELGEQEVEKELITRAAKYDKKLKTMWSASDGIFLNVRTDTKMFNNRVSPTNFYPLISGTASQEQATTMIKNYFNNPKKFAGEWIMPSITRDDKAYKDNEYWRGRIWMPMNFLVYMGMSNYDLKEAKHNLAEKSFKLVMKEWTTKGHLHENYNADTGEGDDVQTSDVFYHWAALGSMIYIIEKGYFKNPMLELK